MKIHYLSIAERELDGAFQWYERQVSGLGYEFLEEIERSIHRITIYPLSGVEIKHGVRRVLVNRFPFCHIFCAEKDAIVIAAVAHQHREPDYWMDRFV